MTGTRLIREATPDDRPRVMELFALLGFEPVDAFDDFTGTVLVACEPDVAGAIAFFVHRFSPVDAGPTLWIDDFAVDPAFRRRGLGRALLDETRRRALDAGCAYMGLHTHEEMTEAMALYDVFGFERHGLFRWLKL